jgi:hypothetical protein
MAQTQTVIKIPGDLPVERDSRRAKQRDALAASAGAWKSKDHPELADGGAAYVEKIRSEFDSRLEEG